MFLLRSWLVQCLYFMVKWPKSWWGQTFAIHCPSRKYFVFKIFCSGGGPQEKIDIIRKDRGILKVRKTKITLILVFVKEKYSSSNVRRWLVRYNSEVVQLCPPSEIYIFGGGKEGGGQWSPPGWQENPMWQPRSSTPLAQTMSPSMHIGGGVMGHPLGVWVLGQASGSHPHVGAMGHPSGPKSGGQMVWPSGHSGGQKLGHICPVGPGTEKCNNIKPCIRLKVPLINYL